MEIGGLTIKMAADMAQLRKDMSDATTMVGGAMDEIKRASDMALKALAGLGAITSINGLVSLVEKTIASAVEMHELSRKTGVAVESLSALRSVAKLSGTDMGAVAGAMQKLSINMVGAEGGTGKAAAAFKALGISVTDGGGKIKSADAVMLEVAKSLQKYESGVGTVTAANYIFGKGGAELIPLLEELAIKGNLNGKMTEEQAQLAYDYSRAVAAAKNTLSGFFSTLALNILPLLPKIASLMKIAAEAMAIWFGIFVAGPAVVGALVTAFNLFAVAVAEGATVSSIFSGVMGKMKLALIEATTGVNLLKTSLAIFGAIFIAIEIAKWAYDNFEPARRIMNDFFVAALKGWQYIKYGAQVAWLGIKTAIFTYLDLVGGYWADFIDGVGKGMAFIGNDTAAKSMKDLADKIRASTSSSIDFKTEMGKLDTELQSGLTSVDKLAVNLDKESTEHFKATGKAKEHKEQLKLAGEAAEESSKAHGQLIESLSKLSDSLVSKTSADAMELEGQTKLTEAQKQALPILEALRDGKATYNELEKNGTLARMNSALAMDKLTQAEKENKKWQDEAQKENQQYQEAIEKKITSLQDETIKQREANATFGLSTAAIEDLRIARLDELAVAADRRALQILETIGDTEAANRQKDLASAYRDAAKEAATGAHLTAAKAAADEWQKTADSIYTGITDSLERAFTSGKGLFKSLWDDIKKAFSSTVLKMVINATVGATGLSGALGSAGAATGASSVGSAMAPSMAAAFATKYGLGSAAGMMGMFNSGATLAMNGGTMVGLEGAGAMMSGGSILQGAAQGAGVAAGWLGPIAIGQMAGRAISGGYSAIGGQSGSTAVNSGTIIGAIVGGPIGAGIGAAIGGLVNRAFGMAAKTTNETGITGTVYGGDVSAQAYAKWNQKGGWFRSDRSGTDLSTLSSDQATGLNSAAKLVFDQTRQWAEILKLPADQLARVNYSLKIKLGTDSAANEKAINEAFSGYQDTLVKSFSTTLAPFQKAGETLTQTFGRLASVQVFSETINELGGVFSRIAGSSLGARENMIDLAGGIDALMSKSQAFVNDYYKESEKFGMQATSIAAALKSVGINAGTLSSRDDYRKLVEGVNLNTEDGRHQLAALLDIAPVFTQLGDYLKANSITLGDAAKAAPQTKILDNLLASSDATPTAVHSIGDQIAEAVDASTKTLQARLDDLQKAFITATSANARLVADAVYENNSNP